MTIGVLYGEKHCSLHDLESFFWVLFWICIHYDGRGKGSSVEEFEKWNCMNTGELARAKKGVISDEGDFLRLAEDYFTPYYQSLIPCGNRLRRLVFPDGGRWKKPNFNLSRNMIETLQDAQYKSDARHLIKPESFAGDLTPHLINILGNVYALHNNNNNNNKST
ncbi:hypothetical protein ACO22_01738 [Paracoccidioides brasiliensis]|uniref:Fungal-type protein kinase domain-containing protein n=1 Tax=Paracoccidioides brasiliensis TaxID=121759 RepID=A0A1D2JKQ0_PARBR|nr:hypothetical protein ACO22_01738 [Paracoccidioides brasiliensis]